MAWTLMILSMICWGSWANTFKLTHGVRFELFYWDYAIGLAIATLLLAWAFDVPSASGAAFPASLLTASSSSLWQAAAAGVVFNLANLLLVACANYDREATLIRLRDAAKEQREGFRWYELST